VIKPRPPHYLRAIRQKTGGAIPIPYGRMVVQALFEWITEELKAGRRVNFHNFGSFKLRMRKGRISVGHVMTREKGGKWVKSANKVTRHHPYAEYVRFYGSTVLQKKIWQVRKPVFKLTSSQSAG